MGKLIILVGLPGSGKSTYAKEFARTHANTFIFSSDEYRERLLHDVNDQSQNELVFKTLYAEARKCLEQDCTAIIDATNMTRKSRKRCLEKFKDMNIIRECHIIPTFFDVCIERDAARERTVGEEVIRRMTASFEVPMLFEGFDEIVIPEMGELVYHKERWHDVADRMRMFDQKNKHHKFTLWNHCQNVYDCMIEELKQEDRSVIENNNLVSACVYHDVGKLYTQTIDEEGQGHYYCHANYSALWILGAGLTENVYNNIEIAFYAGEHMHIRDIVRGKTETINKYRELFGPILFSNLLLLINCDNFGAKQNVYYVLDKYKDIEILEVTSGKWQGITSIIITWSAPDMGVGEYTLYIKEDGTLEADTEYMDGPRLKFFTRAIMKKFAERISII